jgi:hypothetical protein
MFSAVGRRSMLVPTCAAAALLACAGISGATAGTTGAGDRTAYILFGPNQQGVSMSGSTDDLRRARALRAGNEAMLFIRQGSASYVVRDPATLSKARAIFEPQQALGAAQAELGSGQAALGRSQAALGREQARLGTQQANARPREAVELGRRQQALGEQQNVLGRQQNALGERQNALGREQNRLAHEADVKFRTLVADAIQRGLAERVE